MEYITHHQYWNEVKETAEFILDDCLTNGNDIRDFTHETIDGHEWIIYTFYHAQILRFTDNDEAYQDCYSNEDLGRLVAEKGLDHVKMVQAFFALEQDVNEALNDRIQEKREELESTIERLEGLKDKKEQLIERMQSYILEMIEDDAPCHLQEEQEALIERVQKEVDFYESEIEEIETQMELV